VPIFANKVLQKQTKATLVTFYIDFVTKNPKNPKNLQQQQQNYNKKRWFYGKNSPFYSKITSKWNLVSFLTLFWRILDLFGCSSAPARVFQKPII
jgi:hypothetical protein